MFLFSQCDGFAEPDDSSATTGAYSGKQLAIIIKIFFSFLLDFTSINSLYYLIVPILSISLNSIRKTRIDINVPVRVLRLSPHKTNINRFTLKNPN